MCLLINNIQHFVFKVIERVMHRHMLVHETVGWFMGITKLCYGLHRAATAGSQLDSDTHLAVSGLTVRLPVWPWQQVCVKRVRKWGVRATWIFIMTSPVYWLQRGGHTQVRLFGPPESTVNWPGRRREEGGSEHIAHIRVIQVLPVADNWIDEDADTRLSNCLLHFPINYIGYSFTGLTKKALFSWWSWAINVYLKAHAACFQG